MGTKFDIAIVIGARETASGVLRSLSGRFRSFASNTMRRVAATVRAYWRYIVAAGVVGAEEFVRRSVNAFADYEQSIANVATVAGMTGKQLERAKKQLFDYALALSRTSSKMPTEIAGAFYALASAGFSVNEIMKAAPGILALAEGTLSDMGMTSELVTSTMRAFGLSASDTNRIVNTLAASISKSRMTVERLSISLPYAATTAAELGLSMEDTVAALSMLVNRGMAASSAGTYLRMMLVRTTSVTREAQAALAKYGLTQADINIRTRGFIPVLRTLHQHHVAYSDLVKIFGVRAATAAAILSRNVDQYLQLRNAITGTNRAFEMQREQMNTLQRSWAVVKSTFQEIQIRLARALSPTIRAVVADIQQFLTALIDTGRVRDFGNALQRYVGDALTWLRSNLTAENMKAVKEALMTIAKAAAAVGPPLGRLIMWIAKLVERHPWLAVAAVVAYFAKGPLSALASTLTIVRTGLSLVSGLLPSLTSLFAAGTAAAGEFAAAITATVIPALTAMAVPIALVAATLVALYAIWKDIQAATEAARAGAEWRQKQEQEFAQYTPEQRAIIMAAKPTLSERFWGWVTGGGVTGYTYARRRVANELPAALPAQMPAAQQPTMPSGTIRFEFGHVPPELGPILQDPKNRREFLDAVAAGLRVKRYQDGDMRPSYAGG